MPARTTSFQLSEDLDKAITEKVERGEYSSASEVVRVALQRFFERDRREAELHAALDRGLRSGRAEPGVWDRLYAKHGIKR